MQRAVLKVVLRVVLKAVLKVVLRVVKMVYDWAEMTAVQKAECLVVSTEYYSVASLVASLAVCWEYEMAVH